MKRILIQAIVLLALTGAAGTIYNRITAGSDRHLEFFRDYPNARVCTKAGGSTTAPVAKTAESPASPPSATQETSGAAAPAEDDPEPEEGTTAEPPGEELVVHPDGIPHILHDTAHEYWQEGYLFVDARRTPEYVKGHVPGAVSISAWEAGGDVKISKLLETEVVEAPVVVYCTRSKDCEDSHMVAGQLKTAGFVEVYVYQGGFPDWKDHGSPVATGEEPGPRGPEEGDIEHQEGE